MNVQASIEEKFIDSSCEEERSAPLIEHSQWLRRLPTLLRGAGALVIMAASAMFLLQGWSTMNDVTRYFVFLGFTSFLSVCGIYCALRCGDDKSARTFLAVAAAIIPVHFCQLGSFLYSSRFPVSASARWLQWTAPSMVSAVVTVLIAVIILSAVAFLSFSALSRSQAVLLSAFYVLLNALLLIPLRSPDFIGLLLCASLGVLVGLYYLLDFSRPDALTHEARLGYVMLGTPSVLLIIRQVYLHDLSLLFGSAFFAMAGILFFASGLASARAPKSAPLLQALGVGFGAVSWWLFAVKIIDAFDLRAGFHSPVIFLPIALILLAASCFAVSSPKGYRKIAILVANLPLISQVFSTGDLVSSLLCVLVGIMTVAQGYSNKDRGVFLLGGASLMFSLLYHVRFALKVYQFSPWLGLAVLGVGSVLSAAYIEANYHKLMQRFAWLRSS